ncbi:MAG: hypothetical protein IJ874_09325 [Ruminococcus sp.]|nr:hypothetical protein [Ruminococcus sp.]
MTFIKLTAANNNKPIYVNIRAIAGLNDSNNPYSEGTIVALIGGGEDSFYLVAEAPEKVLELIEEAVKERRQLR